MFRFSRGAGACVAVAAWCPAFAYVNIEDFVDAPFSVELTGGHSYSQGQNGLDTAHSAFGKRGWFLDITSNPDQAHLNLDVGNGEQKLSTTSDLLTYNMDLGLGVSGDVLIDLSRESSIYIDLYTDPPHVFADHWSLTVVDVNGVDTSNDGWLLRNGGIQFDIDSFSRPIDWSRVRSVTFFENMDTPRNPTLYSVTHIYAVPEPPALAAGIVALALLRRKPRATGASRKP